MLLEAGLPNRSWVKQQAHDFACPLLYELWREDFLRLANPHSNEYTEHAVEAATLRRVDELKRAHVHLAALMGA